MELPRRVIVGDGALTEFPRLVAGLVSGTLLAVSGPNVRKMVQDQLNELATSSGYKLAWCEVAQGDRLHTDNVLGMVRSVGADGILGVGGGRVVDVAKLVAHLAHIPMFSIPTSASHDGIAIPFASLREMERPYSVVATAPMGVLADLSIIRTAPERLLKSGCGDLVAKLTAVSDWKLARDEKNEYYGHYSASLAEMSASIVFQHADGVRRLEPSSVRAVVEALISSGVAAGIAGSSRPCSGAEHIFSHALETIAPGRGLHGEKCGIGTILIARLHGLDWARISDALKTIGAPVRASDLGLSADQVADAVRLAPSIRPERYTILHKLRLSYEEALKLAREVQII